MPANNADFRGYVTAWRFSHRKHNHSIDSNGLKISPPGAHVFEEGDVPRGVYGYDNFDSVQKHASGFGNCDLYEFKVHPSEVNQDPWLDDAIYSEKAIPKQQVTRIGHVTAEGELHMHKVEHCND